MCLCGLCIHRVFSRLNGTTIFRAYCRSRGLDRAHSLESRVRPPDVPWAVAAIARLPPAQRGAVERELAALDELHGPGGIAHLLEAAGDACPPPECIPDGSPVALWFLLHRPDVFWEVYFHHEARDPDVWHTARTAAGVRIDDVDGRGSSLGRAISELFERHEGTGRYCVVQPFHLPGATAFVARIAGRPRMMERIPGRHESRWRPLADATCVQFVYYRRDGTVLLQAPFRSLERIRDLRECFGRTVVRASVEGTDFALDRLKRPFHPLADAPDMDLVRVKSLHLQYPERAGRRQIKLETLTTDSPAAIDELLRAHVGGATIDTPRVVHAVLHVRLRIGGRPKHHLIRLWPDRCDVGGGHVRDRILTCLRRWGL